MCWRAITSAAKGASSTGAYLGSSSLALGLGLRDRRYPSGPVIDAFDQFTIDANSVANYLDPSIDSVMPGNNVRHIYDRNIAPIAKYVSVHEGDVAASPGAASPSRYCSATFLKAGKSTITSSRIE